MPDLDAINRHIQRRLRSDGLPYVTAVEANRWLDQAGLLRDDLNRPGKPLRVYLRGGEIRGAWQDPPGPHGRWFIGSDTRSAVLPAQKSAKPQRSAAPRRSGRLPPSLRDGVDIVIVGERPGKRSLQVRCYYADSSNSFWRDLYETGFTQTLFDPCDYARLLDLSPSIGLDDLYANPRSLWRRLTACQPGLVVFNSKRARALAEDNAYGRRIMGAFESAVLYDSSGNASGWRRLRLKALLSIRKRFR